MTLTKIITQATMLWTDLRHGRRGCPLAIGISTSMACNRRCSYCVQSKENIVQQVITDAMWGLFVDQLREARWHGLVGLVGIGEPTLIPDKFLRFVEDIVRIGCRPFLFTNGRDLDQVEDWMEAGASRIIVCEHEPYGYAWHSRWRAMKARWAFVRPFALKLKHLTPETTGDYGHNKPTWQGGLPLRRCTYNQSLSYNIDGTVMLCCIDYHRYAPALGDLSRPMWKTWFDPGFVAIRRNAQIGSPTLPVCRVCLHLAPPPDYPQPL